MGGALGRKEAQARANRLGARKAELQADLRIHLKNHEANNETAIGDILTEMNDIDWELKKLSFWY